jgi:hypothetical protein
MLHRLPDAAIGKVPDTIDAEGAMRCCRSLVVVLVLMAPCVAGEASAGPVDEIVGTWRGTSACVDRQAAPACTDEQVIYEIAASPGQPNSVTVRADKVVDGKRVSMGDLEFTYDASSGSWTSEFENPRTHALWRLSVTGTTLKGTLTLLPSKAVVRRMNLKKGT